MQNQGKGLSAVNITSARFASLAGASGLVPGASYWITDTALMAIATSVGGFVYVRQQVRADIAFYVSPSGSDANDGLSARTAFLTLQKAWNALCRLDLATFTGTINVADGAYAAGIASAAMPVGGSAIYIVGNTTTPTAVTITSALECFRLDGTAACPVYIRGFSLATTGVSKAGINIGGRATVTTTYINCAGMSGGGNSGFYNVGRQGSRIVVSTGQTISGDIPCYASAAGGVIQFYNTAITLTAVIAVSWNFVVATYLGTILAAGVTFQGSATGRRYIVTLNSLILTNTSDPNYFPGSIAGTASTGGQYA